MPAAFSGNPLTEWLVNPTGVDRDMRLLADFSFTDGAGRVWSAPLGSVVNGASIPQALWSSVGSPYTDDYRRASVVHDVACSPPGLTKKQRKEADEMFHEACLAGGCSKAKARVLYLGVRLGAWADDLPESMGVAAAPSPGASLNRLPGERTTAEILVRAKFAELATLLEAKKATTVAQIDKVLADHGV